MLLIYSPLLRYNSISDQLFYLSHRFKSQNGNMAYPGKLMMNSVTGHQYKFIQTSRDTAGELLEMEVTYKAHLKEPPPHYHPYQSEEFTILSGELTVNKNGKTEVYKSGDQFRIPANEIHSMWNDSHQPAIVNWKITPALNSEYLFETTVGLANEGKTNTEGLPSLLQLAVMLPYFESVFRTVKPPYAWQKIIFNLLAPIARMKGYEPFYKKYIN